MKAKIILILFFVATNSFAQKKQHETSKMQLAKLVNPFIGTGGHGHTFPGPTMPFGACQVGPDTRLEGWDGCGAYHYDDSVIYGFSHTHLSGTGCSDYGDILLMPVTKQMPLDKYQYASKFSHKNEQAHAGFYEVFLDDPKINVELTSTLHGGFHQYTFQKNDEQFVVLDLKHRDEVLDSKMEQVDDYTIRGYRFSKAWAKNQKVFFEIKFSNKIESIKYEELKTGSNTSAIHLDKSLHCLIKFKALDGSNKATDDTDDTDGTLKIRDNSYKTSDNTDKKVLTAKVAISGVDEEGAHKNLMAEMPDGNWNFNDYQTKAEQEWEKELSKIQIGQFDNEEIRQSNKSDNKHSLIDKLSNSQIVFYTALYHCMIHPSIYNDVDGRYRGRDDKIHNTEGKFNYYTVFSLWDTYRALHPLLTILDKKRTNDFINTFIKQYEQVGRLPIWELSSNETNCMIGYHVVSVIWDAYNKGIRDYDVNKAFEAMKSIATQAIDYTDGKDENDKLKMNENARSRCADADALESYNKYGYVRSDDSHESVSKTLEYAYDDWCIAQMANALGKKEDYEYYTKRSHNWMNVYDPTTGFMRARKNGSLYEPFSPYTVDNNYTEANAWQYSFYVPHDIELLIHLQGGQEEFEKKLDDLFEAKEKTEGREQADITGLIGQYAHGNEPSHQIINSYAFTKSVYKKEKQIKYILDSFYTNQPDGLMGNEDCGQMSAWYVLNALGIYPFCPGDNKYYISKPIFEKVEINHESSIIEKSAGVTGTRCFYTFENYPYISHKDFVNRKKTILKNNYDGNHIHYKYKASLWAYPSNPFITKGKRIFKDSVELFFNTSNLNCKEGVGNQLLFLSHEKIFVSIDESAFKNINRQSIVLKNNSNIKFYAQKIIEFTKPNTIVNSSFIIDVPQVKSPIQTATFTKLPSDRKIILKNQYNKSYHAGGADGLMDGIYGKLNWRAGDWQGYQGQDVEVIMVFDKPKAINKIGANFLEDQNSWIFYPKEVSFYVSNDSVNWALVENIPTNKSDHEEKTTISKFQSANNQIPKSKFIKMSAKNFGLMPQWHEGRGEQTFIFIDEFIVE